MELKYTDYLKKYNFKHPIEYSKNKELNQILREDLEMDSDASLNILNNLYLNDDTKKNKYNLLLNKWSSLYSVDKQYLKDMQSILKKYKIHENKMDEFINEYIDFKREQNFISKYQYIQFSRLQYLNKIVPFLQVLALYNFCSPLFSLIAPLIGLIIPYFVLYAKGIRLGFSNYLVVIKNIITKQYFIKGILNFAKNTLQNNIYLLTSIFFYFMSIYNNIISCIQFYKNTDFIISFTEKYDKFISEGDELIDNIYNYTSKKKSFGEFNKNMIRHKENIKHMRSCLHSICSCKDKIKKMSMIGCLLKNNFEIFYEDSYDETVGFLIYLNNYNYDIYNISKLLKGQIINECKYIKNKKDKPKINEGYYLNNIGEKNVTNDVSMKNNLIITGPNASGKTTMIKSCLINLFLSQSIGCGCYGSCRTHLYDYYHSYLNIPDTSNRDSLFQAEARRCKDIIMFIEKHKNKRHFCIFDEIYSGTNPSDAVLCANIYLNGMNEYKENVDYILTTHYIDMCEKFEKNKYVSNKKMMVNCVENNRLEYTYKVVDGISYVNGGYQILEQLEYPKHLLKK